MQKKQYAVSKVAKSSRTEPVKATVVCFLFSFFNLSNGSVYEATEPAVKASEAAHEATEPAAKGKRGSPCTTQREHENILFRVRNDRAWTFDNGSKQDMDKFWKPEDAWMFEHVA